MMIGLMSLIGVNYGEASDAMTMSSSDSWNNFQRYVTNSDKFSNFIENVLKKNGEKLKENSDSGKLMEGDESLKAQFEELMKGDKSLKKANINDYITYLDTEFCDPDSLEDAALEYSQGKLDEKVMESFLDALEKLLLKQMPFEEDNEIKENLNELKIFSMSPEKKDDPKRRLGSSLNEHKNKKIKPADEMSSIQGADELSIEIRF